MSTYREEFLHREKTAKKVWRLHDGTEVSSEGLKNMFMGKIPNPAARRLLGIEKIV